MTSAQVARDLAITAIDLTRACAAHELYIPWLEINSLALNGSAGIANYFCLAAMAFEEQAHPHILAEFDAFVARENFSDILMASAPLTCQELQAAVKAAIQEAREDHPLADARIPATDFGLSIPIQLPATHGKFEATAK